VPPEMGEERDHGIMRRWRNLRDGFFNPKNRNTLPSKRLKSGENLNQFFRQLAGPLDPALSTRQLSPEQLERLLNVAAEYGYWIGSAWENAAIGISLITRANPGLDSQTWNSMSLNSSVSASKFSIHALSPTHSSN
jgi:hypothetical protein